MSDSEASCSDTDETVSAYEEVSWLDWLPNHPIFSQSDLASDPLPASPDLSAIDVASEVSSNASLHEQTFHAPRVLSSSKKMQVLSVIRETELVVAVGSELRICNLATVKNKLDAQGHASTSRLEDYGGYKVLDVPAVDFPVVSLVPSPANPKLLAVVGESQVVVVVIPRKEWSALISSSVTCKTAPIGAFYHSKSASTIASVKWHPLGWKGASLCVLTSDGILREYDLNGNAEDPVNALDFTQEGLAKRTKGKQASFFSSSASVNSAISSSFRNSTFTMDDVEDQDAVSLSFGTDGTLWGPMTVYCLLADGTMYAACPYLPHEAQWSKVQLESLGVYTDLLRAESAKRRSQAPTSHTFDSTPTKTYDHVRLDARIAAQTRFIASVRALSDSPLASTDESTDLFKIHTSDLPKALTRPRRQGPFLIQPSPPELPGRTESEATDLHYLHWSPKDDAPGVGVFLFGFSDGKVDVCIETLPVEARWEAQNEADLPVLLLYESLDLGLARLFQDGNDWSALEKNALRFEADPIHSDLTYVSHLFGSHSISLLPWVEEVARGKISTAQPRSALHLELSTTSMNDPNNSLPVIGCCLIRDVYLGYSILQLTSSFQLVARELSLAVELAEAVPAMPAVSIDEGPAYLALLSRPTFELPPPFNKPLHSLTQPRFALPSGEPNTGITANKLRFLGQTVEKLRVSIRDLTQANSAVQARFDTQCKELARQLGKIAEASQLLSSNERSLSTLEQRLGGATATQKILVRRLDESLHRLRQSHVPKLSEKEKEWFDELGQYQKELDDDAHGKTLRARLDQVKMQLHMLREQIGRQKGVDGAPAGESDPDMARMGRSQIKRIEAMLVLESQAIEDAKKKVLGLQDQLSSDGQASGIV